MEELLASGPQADPSKEVMSNRTAVTVAVSVRQRFRGALLARTWFRQFRDLVLYCAVRIADLSLRPSNRCFQALKHGQSSRIMYR